MYAFKHKTEEHYLLVVMENDNWGNSTINLIAPAESYYYRYFGAAVYVQHDRQLMQDIIDNGEVGEYSGHKNVGGFNRPFNYTDMSQYDIVELKTV